MRFKSRLPLVMAACLLTIAAPRMAAAQIDDAAATSLEQQLHDFLAGLLGPAAKIGERPVHIAASDDHFAIELPVGDLIESAGGNADAANVTATAKPLDGGRWQIDEIEMPSPVSFAMPLPDGPGKAEWTITMDSQSQRAMLDPSMATATTLDSTINGYGSAMRRPDGTDHTRIEQMTSHMTFQPTGGGRGDVLQDLDGSLLTLNTVSRDTGPVSLSAAKLHGVVHINGVAPAQIGPILRAALELAPLAANAVRESNNQVKPKDAKKQPGSAKAAASGGHLPKAAKAALRSALTAMQELATGLDEQGSLEDVRFQTAGFSGHAARLSSGMGMSATNGKLSLRLRFGLDGLTSPDLPEGVIRDYLPRHFAVAPRVSGLPAAEVMKLLQRALDSDGNDPGLDRQFEALMNKGPITVGVEELALDSGPATLKGNGELHVISKDNYSGEAHLATTGLDALIRRANTIPELKQAAPILIFLKGIGQQDGDRVVWDISYTGKKLLVNGNDVSEMMPGK